MYRVLFGGKKRGVIKTAPENPASNGCLTFSSELAQDLHKEN